MSNTRSKSLVRSVKGAIINPRIIAMEVRGTQATPDSRQFGSSEFQAASVTDLGAGNYTIIFNEPFERECMLMGWSSSTAGAVECQVTAIAFDRITIQVNNAAGAALDADVSLMILGSDGRYNVGR